MAKIGNPELEYIKNQNQYILEKITKIESQKDFSTYLLRIKDFEPEIKKLGEQIKYQTLLIKENKSSIEELKTIGKILASQDPFEELSKKLDNLNLKDTGKEKVSRRKQQDLKFPNKISYESKTK